MSVPDSLGHPDAAHLPSPSAPPGAVHSEIPDLDLICESILGAGDGPAQAKAKQCIARLVAGRDRLVKMAHALDEKQRMHLAEQVQAFYKRCVAKAMQRAASKEASR